MRSIGQEDPALGWTLVELAPDAILLVGPDGCIQAANERAGDLFGYDHDDFRGLPVDDLVPPDARRLHTTHRAAFDQDPHRRDMGTGLALSAVRKDGSTFPVEVGLGPVELAGGDRAVVAIVRDISERVRAQRRILEIQDTLDASLEGVFVFDADSLRFVYANQGAATQVGYPLDDLLTMTPLDLTPSIDEEDFRDLLQPLLAGRMSSRTVATRHRRRDGSEFDVECVFQPSPTSRENGGRSIVAFCRDVTERLETERQLRATEQELHVLEDRERIARDLHDTVIQRLFAAGMSLQATGARAEGATAERIRDVVDELDETIRDIRQAIFRLTVHNLDQASVRRRVVEVVEDEQGPLGLSPELAFNGPLETMDDEVVDNLLATLREALSNVARHADAGRVQVEVSVDDDDIRLTVVDDGVGIAPDHPEGNGLGNMAQRATGLGGTASVERAMPRGTRLTWSVPC